MVIEPGRAGTLDTLGLSVFGHCNRHELRGAFTPRACARADTADVYDDPLSNPFRGYRGVTTSNGAEGGGNRPAASTFRENARSEHSESKGAHSRADQFLFTPDARCRPMPSSSPWRMCTFSDVGMGRLMSVALVTWTRGSRATIAERAAH